MTDLFAARACRRQDCSKESVAVHAGLVFLAAVTYPINEQLLRSRKEAGRGRAREWHHSIM